MTNHEQVTTSYESFAYAMNFISEFHDIYSF